ncbi:MAG TPA: hypothetical protein VI731_11015 [Bacteroidia bacterium]|nr:hypothetical protein [Bacteroidia bacterium]
MKSYIQHKGEKLFLPKQVDPNKWEVGVTSSGGEVVYMLCPKVSARYVQATGLFLFREIENELVFTWINKKDLERVTFPLHTVEFCKIQVDYNAGGPVVIPSPESQMNKQ